MLSAAFPGTSAAATMADMPPGLDPHFRHLLVAQDNVVALWQLQPAQRRATLRAARLRQWRRLTRRTYLAAPGTASENQLLWASLLHCGKHARISGRAALILHGWPQEHQRPYDVVVPSTTHHLAGPSWLRAHRIIHPIDGPAASPQRTQPHLAAAHAASWARTDREAMFIVISALQNRLITPTRLKELVGRLPRLRRRSLILQVAGEYAGGAHSLNELDFAALCEQFGVPAPVRQRRVCDAHGVLRAIDAEFTTASGRTIRVEIEGLQHLDPAQYFADVTRHNDLALADPAVSLRITTWHLQHEPATFMRSLATAILEG